MELTRRNMLAVTSAALAASAFGASPAFASLTDDEIAKITGGAETVSGDLTVTAPEIAENGNTVPIEVSPRRVPSAWQSLRTGTRRPTWRPSSSES